MKANEINKKDFEFEHLPKFAKYLLANIEEYVTVNIRFSREVDLPLLKPLAKIPETELVKMSINSNKMQLNALVNNTIFEHIETNLNNWSTNKLGIGKDGKALIDKSEINAKDLVLTFYIKRKTFYYFLYGYTQNPSVKQLIINEVDKYTSYEELASLEVYLSVQKDIREGKL